ncbi:helix-turn-helix domain-containing protein [Marinovum sp.]|uniref:helix-turn-helix domain-containing protein n=1 Tax=Marinovum sp. TaxID=2024839 RepID=UPI002B2722CB|nr:helix-turn-helix domain-containing protein [Marinovum sp.]
MTTQTTARTTRGPGNFVPAYAFVDRWAVLQLVKDTAEITGIREREISILAAHLSVLPKGKLNPGQMLISYAQVTGILERANCMDERRFRRGEARLEELGLVVRKLSGNGRRFPVRDGKGRVIDAYGIDLAPLFSRIAELQHALQQHRDQMAEMRSIRSRISATLSTIKRHAIDEMSNGLAERLADFRNRLRRRNVPLVELADIETEVMTLSRKYRGSDPKYCRNDHIGCDQNSAKESADSGQIVRHIESPKKEYSIDASIDDPKKVWQRCSVLSQFYPETPTTLPTMIRALFDFLGYLGLRQTWRETLVKSFGLSNALRVANYLAEHIESISEVDAYIKQMIAEYRRGNAVAAGTVGLPLTAQL